MAARCTVPRTWVCVGAQTLHAASNTPPHAHAGCPRAPSRCLLTEASLLRAQKALPSLSATCQCADGRWRPPRPLRRAPAQRRPRRRHLSSTRASASSARRSSCTAAGAGRPATPLGLEHARQLLPHVACHDALVLTAATFSAHVVIMLLSSADGLGVYMPHATRPPASPPCSRASAARRAARSSSRPTTRPRCTPSTSTSCSGSLPACARSKV